MRNRLSYATILLFLAMAPARVSAQANEHWKQIGQLPVSANGYTLSITCGFFWDKKHGLVGANGAEEFSSSIWYTEDGSTWKQAAFPPSQSGIFTCIYMQDRDTGWASRTISTTFPSCVLFRTTDGGKSWTKATGFDLSAPAQSINIPSAFFDGPGIFEIARSAVTGELFFPGWGARFTPPQVDGMGCAWRSQKDGLFSSRFGPWYKTSDGGNSWTAVTADGGREMWGMYGSQSWNCYVVAYDRSNEVGISSNDGSSWIRQSIPAATTLDLSGDVQGARFAVYCQASAYFTYHSAKWPPNPQLPLLGLFRTTDSGGTWVNVGGPSNDLDTRFCVLGCTGAIVIAFDPWGGIWLTEDGGDGALHETPARPCFSVDSLTIAAALCKDSIVGFRFWDDHCDAIIISRLWFEDSSLVRSGALRFVSSPTLPRSYKTDEWDSIQISWQPSAAFVRDTSITIRIGIRYLSGTTGLEQDTFIPLTLTAVKGQRGHTLSTTDLRQHDFSTCEVRDTLVEIRNIGCLPMTMNATLDAAAVAAGYTIISGQGPLLVASGGVAFVRLMLTPISAGLKRATLRLVFDEQGESSSAEVALSANVTQGEGIPNMIGSNHQFLARTICEQDDSVFLKFFNSGCDSMVVDAVMLSGDPEFGVSTQPQVPLTLHPGDTLTIGAKITTSLKQKGLKTGTVTIRFHNIHGDTRLRDTLITLEGTIADGTPSLAIDSTPVDLGSGSFCRTADTVIRFSNTGCDTLTIGDASLVGADFVVISAPAKGLRLGPGEESSITVRYVPTQAGSAAAKVLVASSDPDHLLVTVPLSASSTGKDAVGFVSAMSRADISPMYDTVTFRVYPTSLVQSKALHSIAFDLVYNGDLLTRRSRSTSTNAQLSFGDESREGKLTRLPVTLTSADMALDPSKDLVSILFFTQLTDTNNTRVEVQNLRLNDNDETYRTCVLSASDANASALSVVLSCGDGLVQRLLQGGKQPLEILSVNPNPSHDAVKLTLQSSRERVTNVTVLDALGHEMHREVVTIGREPKDVRVESSAWPSGVYVVRLESGGVVKSRMFVRE